MMSLSHSTGYAVHALSSLEAQSQPPRLIRDIAQRTGIPKPYLAKIINQLSHKGIVIAKRGYRGGICLARAAQDISLLEIVLAVEGPHWIGDCLLAMDHTTGVTACPTQAAWKRIKREIEAILRETTLADVVRGLKKNRRTASSKRKMGRAPVAPNKSRGPCCPARLSP